MFGNIEEHHVAGVSVLLFQQQKQRDTDNNVDSQYKERGDREEQKTNRKESCIESKKQHTTEKEKDIESQQRKKTFQEEEKVCLWDGSDD